MSYYPRPHPYMDAGYYDGYQSYGYYGLGGAGYGRPRPFRPYGGFPRGRGRGRGGFNASSNNKTVETTVKSEPAPAAPENTEVTAEPGVKIELEGDDVAPVVSTTTAVPEVNTLVATTATSATSAAAAAVVAATAAAATSVASADASAKAQGEDTLTAENPLPAEITDKFFPNRCDLCSVVFPVAKDIFIPETGGLEYMKSNLQSTMHFGGKSHKKKLRSVFHEYCVKNRVKQVPKEARDLMKETPALPKETNREEAEKVDLYCKTCDLSFTSVQHASQHYAGKNHQRKLEGKPPLRSGYYNPRTGRWQRQPPEEFPQRGGYFHRPYGQRGGASRPVTAPSAASADTSVITVEVSPGAGAKPAAAVNPAGTGTGVPSKFFCSICNVSATSQATLDTHINGSKHKLQAMKLGVRTPPKSAPKPAATAPAAAASNGTPVNGAEPNRAKTESGLPPAKRPARDYSIYKTPTGRFYCLPCNLTMNSEIQFAQHFDSKKHKYEASKQRSGVAAAH